MKAFKRAVLAVVFVSVLPHNLFAAEGEQATLNYGQWLGALGASGLRRSLASGSDFGELVNRGTSYKMAAQVAAMRERQRAAGLNPPPEDYDSTTDAWVAQSDSLLPLGRPTAPDHLLRVSLRRAERYEDERVDARSDRLEAGLFKAFARDRNEAGYLGLSVMLETSEAEPGFVEASRDADALGLRLDYGRVLNETWAFSGRLEHANWSGEGYTVIPSPAGATTVYQDTEFDRDYLTLDLIARYPLAFLTAGQLRWRSSVNVLRNRYDDQINSLGQPVREPFGPVERLGLVRTGAYLSWRAGEGQQWSPYVELNYDYEFTNNMDRVIEDPHTISLKGGLARLIKPGWRAQLDVQRYQGLGGERARNSATLALVFDF